MEFRIAPTPPARPSRGPEEKRQSDYRRQDAQQRLVGGVAVLLPVSGALIVSFLVTPAAIESGEVVLSPPCLTKQVLGIPCPSCGMTRAFTAFSHGQFELGWSYNLLSPFVYLLFWVLLFHGARITLLALRDWARAGWRG